MILNFEVNCILVILCKVEFGFLGVIVEKLIDKLFLLLFYRIGYEIFILYGFLFNFFEVIGFFFLFVNFFCFEE